MSEPRISDAARARGVIEKRRCPHCGKRVARNKGGTLRRHNSKGPVGQPCPGSGLVTR